MRRLLSAFAWMGLLLIIGRTQTEDAKKSLEKLQGTWEIIEVVNDGHRMPQEKVKGGKVWFNGDEMTIKEYNNDENPRKFRIRLNPNRYPKAIDMIALNRWAQGTIIPAIYWLQADSLKLCSPNIPDAKERPKQLKSEEGSKVILLILRRVKS
jgi:uncharacterized protein (TIGR03067 family)